VSDPASAATLRGERDSSNQQSQGDADLSLISAIDPSSSIALRSDFKLHKPEDVVKSAMTKLAKNGKGILLMHDFQHATAEAMPELLRQLKAGGYKIVHMVFAVGRSCSVHMALSSLSFHP
jgi:3-dehydroquinate dehydratase